MGIQKGKDGIRVAGWPFYCVMFFFWLLTGEAKAGVTGSLSGYVFDAKSKKPLAGVNILIEDTEFGGVTDKNGYYVINNIPAGTYNVRTSMLGYAPYKITGVVIKTDLVTRVDFELKLKAFIIEPDPKVVVTAKRFPIKKETLSSSVYLDYNDLTRKLPIDSYLDSFKFLPGVYGSHFRGGRSRDVIYLLDGVPIMSPLTRDVAFNLPTSAISEILVHKGGFSAEYGNAAAGIVNIISKRGRNNFSFSARSFSDNVGLSTFPTDNTRRFEIGFGGPMTVSFGGPVVEMNYFISADLNLTNGPFKDQLRPYYKDPIKSNYNLFGVYDVRLSRNIRLSLQGIVTRWQWRGIDPMFSYDPAALPLRSNRRWRFTAMLTHTITPTMFYYITAGVSKLKDEINGKNPEGQPDVQFSPSPLSTELDITPWNQRSEQLIYFLHLSFLKQITKRMHFKSGLKGEYYELSLSSDRFIDLPARDENGYYFVRRISQFTRYPRYLAGYGELRYESSLFKAQAGLRLDYLNVNEYDPNGPFEDSTFVVGKLPGIYTLSPRLALSIPLNVRHQFMVNYGQFVQVPPFYYFYAGSGAESETQPEQTVWPLRGKADLSPITSRSIEFSYLYTADAWPTFSITAFFRRYHSLIETRTQLLSANHNTEDISTYYQNQASSRSRGLELEVDYSFSSGNQLKFIYTYMEVTGTSNRPEEGYFKFINYGYIPPPSDRPLNWDQRHTFILESHFKPYKNIDVSIISRTYSSRRWEASTPESQRSEKVPWRNFLDIRVGYSWKTKRFKITPFVEIRNMFNYRFREDTDAFYLIHNQPFLPFEERLGRRIRIGFQIN